MRGRVFIRDFRAIREADIELSPGIMLISARNGAGKSTVFKALKALLDGSFGGDENFRHGRDSYSIGLEVDGRSVLVERVAKETFLSVDGNPPVSKLGRNPLSKLAPDFPFRRVEWGDDVFYPNFSFQGSVPVFEDISVFDLFSSMFGEVSRVSARVDALKRDRQKRQRELEDALANLGYAGSRLAEARQWLSDFDEANPCFDEELRGLSAKAALLDEARELEGRVSSFEASDGFVEGYALFRLARASASFFPFYELVVAVSPRAGRVRELREGIAGVQRRLGGLPRVDQRLVSLGARVRGLRDALVSLQGEMDKNQLERDALLGQLGGLVMDERGFREELDRAYGSGDNEAYLSVLSARFQSRGCPYRGLGVCPIDGC